MEKPKMGLNKKWWWVIGGVLVIILGISAYFISPLFLEKNDTPAEVKEEEKSSLPADMFQWSTMSNGPYRDKISFATSTDLLNWTDSETVLAEHASVPDIVFRDGVLYAYFVDVTTDGKPEQIGLLKSKDLGKTWEDRKIVNITGIGDKATADPAPVLLSDGRIRVYFFDINKDRIDMANNPKPKIEEGEKSAPADAEPTTHYIYSATSTDGLNFEMDEGYRLESQEVFDPDVVKVGETWYMYLGKLGNIAVATSTDGLTFTEKGTALKNAVIPSVVYEKGKFYMYCVPEGGQGRGIGMYSSSDGLNFSPLNRYFDGKSAEVADPGAIKMGESSYIMMYKILTPPTEKTKEKK